MFFEFIEILSFNFRQTLRVKYTTL